MTEPSKALAPLIGRGGRPHPLRLKREGQSILLVEQNIKLALDLADGGRDPQHRPRRVSGSAGQVRNDQP